jgi:hypothetical protein
MQLPLNFTEDDFINDTSSDKGFFEDEISSSNFIHSPKTIPNTYFVAAKHNNNKNNIHPQQQQPHDAVCCVVESKGCSFTVHRIETSNTLILVPPKLSPHLPRTETNTNDTYRDDEHDQWKSGRADDLSSKPKKLKGDTTTKLTQVLSAHLIQKPNTIIGGGGSSGSYFLELRRKYLRLSDLRRALVVFDPYSINNSNHPNDNDTPRRIGRSVYDLASSLQVSQSEIHRGLQYIGAYALPSEHVHGDKNRNQLYCLLAEHIINDCYAAIVTGLYTMSDFTDDYGGTDGIINIDRHTFVKNIVHHVQDIDDERIINIDSILLHCLQLLQKDPQISNGKFILDVSKVRVLSCFVHGLFIYI